MLDIKKNLNIGVLVYEQGIIGYFFSSLNHNFFDYPAFFFFFQYDKENELYRISVSVETKSNRHAGSLIGESDFLLSTNIWTLCLKKLYYPFLEYDAPAGLALKKTAKKTP